ncbi:turripeptide Ici9.2-like [Chironomus tepperi]|uniref:turripeptide Ici9.2-like n=1 Tax=Chironomus tepperi TaxID=113505 RepID=UPI00391F45A3
MKYFVILAVAALIVTIYAQDDYEAKKCNTNCTDEYKPICGYYDEPKDGLTFQNNCVLETYYCYNDDLPFAGVDDGECPK